VGRFYLAGIGYGAANIPYQQVPQGAFMGTAFWIKRFLTVLVGAFVIICVAQMLKGHDFYYAATQGAIWGVITATVFTVARLYQSSKAQHCAICKDTPEMQQSGRSNET
jgi:hypothetical protein